MIEKIKAEWAFIKTNKVRILIIFAIGFVIGGLLWGSIGAGIQSIKDKVNFADKKIEEKKK